MLIKLMREFVAHADAYFPHPPEPLSSKDIAQNRQLIHIPIFSDIGSTC